MFRRITPTLLALAALPHAAHAMSLDDALSETKEALAFGKTSLFLRTRYEHVDQDTPVGVAPAVVKGAEAITTRFALGYETKAWHGLSAMGQYEGVFHTAGKNFNSGVNGQTDYPLVIDPEGSELNQAWLKYAPSYVPRTAVRAGRQELSLDNQRWVGPVAWRQNWQSFDAVQFTSGYVQNLNFTYVWLDHVHRITGDASPVGDLNFQSSHLINANYKLPDVGSLTAYAYLLDFDEDPRGAAAAQAAITGFRRQSTETFGARVAGPYVIDNDWSLVYTAEYAKQADYGDHNDRDIDASYILGELGAEWRKLSLKVGYELLSGSGDPGDKLSTPLATLHAFNGWADLFLNTPDTGLTDTYVWFAGPIPLTVPWLDSFRIGAMWHQFDADEGSATYGTELDLLLEYAVKKLDPNLVIGVKYADYNADEGEGAVFAGTTQRNLDTEKIWLYGQYSF